MEEVNPLRKTTFEINKLEMRKLDVFSKPSPDELPQKPESNIPPGLKGLETFPVPASLPEVWKTLG